jgi:hypothetical protein
MQRPLVCHLLASFGVSLQCGRHDCVVHEQVSRASAVRATLLCVSPTFWKHDKQANADVSRKPGAAKSVAKQPSKAAAC